MMMRRKLLLLMLSLMFIGASQAQTGKIKPKDTTFTFKYLIGSDWTFTWGNVNSFISFNQAQFQIEQRVIGAKLQAKYRYGELEAVTNYNEFNTNLDLMLFPKNRVYLFANGGVEFSFLRGVNLRASGGLGAGFKVLNMDDHLFEPTISVSYENNNYDAP